MAKGNCCIAQFACCCTGKTFRFCCRICPIILESTATRLMYVFILLLSTIIMCLSLSPEVEKKLIDKIPHFDHTCQILSVGANCQKLVGFMAVYRMAFAIAAFFLIMSVLTIGVSKSRGCRAGIHNGYWLIKYFVIAGLCVGAFSIPTEMLKHFQTVWMYIALVGGVSFIIIQLWLLVFFAKSMSKKIRQRVEQGSSACFWYGVSSLVTALCYAVGLIATILLFRYFSAWDGCNLNKIFIGVNAGLCVVISLISFFVCCGRWKGHPQTSTLQSGLISLYILYLTWNALSSVPREPKPVPESWILSGEDGKEEKVSMKSTRRDEIKDQGIWDQEYYCGPDDSSSAFNEWVLSYAGVAIMFFTVVCSSIGTSSDQAVALGISVSSPPRSKTAEKQGCWSCRKTSSTPVETIVEDEGGQRVERNEWDGASYNYSFFHVIFCLASMYIMMNLTAWFRPEETNLTSFNKNWATVWIKMGSSWACVLIYVVGLFASNRRQDLRRTNEGNLATAMLSTSSPAHYTRRECIERETVT